MMYKRMLTPLKSPGKTSKRRRSGTTPLKIKNFRTETSSRSAAARMIEHSNYQRAFNSLYNNFRGARKAILNVVKNAVRKEMTQFAKKDSTLTQQCDMETLGTLEWNTILKEISDNLPILYTAISAALTTKNNEKTMQRNVAKSLKPVTVMCHSMILHMRFPQKFKLLQDLAGIEIWRHGAHRKLFQHLNAMGLCCSRSTTMRILSKIRIHTDADLRKAVQDIENIPEPDPDETIPAVQSSENTESTTSYSEQDSLQPSNGDEREDNKDLMTSSSNGLSEDSENRDFEMIPLESSDSEAESTFVEEKCLGFTLVWDNVGKEVKARHQGTGRQNKMKLWALCYAAISRIPTAHLDSFNSTPASDIPVHCFLPRDWEIERVRSRVKTVVSRIFVKHMPFFRDNFSKVLSRHIRHQKWRESSKKSEVINLGVLQEDPSTIAGTIKILTHLHQYVPERNGHLVPILSYGDGLTCERHNDAHKARVNGATPTDRLEGLQPAVQEFHKRMLMMQDIMNQFFRGSSLAEKGTLCHLKNAFGHRNVSKDVGETFNYVSDFMYFVTVGYTILLGMKAMELEHMDGEPIDWSELDEMSEEEKRQYLDHLSNQVVTAVWRDLKVGDVLDANEEKPYEYCICKKDVDKPMIECSGVLCQRGKWFHMDCIGLKIEDVPDDDWFCCRKCTESARDVRLTGAAEKNVDENKDHKYEYVSSLLLSGLIDLAQKDCVRENDGPMMMAFWKFNMLQFHNRNHHKYVILGHRLIAGVSGWLPARLANDLIWNRTVNISGGPGRNLEMDLVNEMLNREFKDALKAAAGNVTEETVNRHSQVVGHLGQKLDKIFGSVSGIDDRGGGKKAEVDISKDLQLFVAILKKEQLFEIIPGREFRSFPKFTFQVSSKYPLRLHKKIKELSKRLDRLNKITG